MKDEIQKQLNAGGYQWSSVPRDWSMLPLFPTIESRVRACFNFQDLNKANTKDDFSLPHINLLVNNITGHLMLSFIDGFSSYNHILMATKDMEKTFFITKWGTYYYRVMPFGLKNT